MGHFLTAKLFGLEVDCIEIYPYGGISKCNIPLNYSIPKEMIILINGPLFQQFAFLLLIRLFPYYASTIRIYHYAMLLFNLLPIIPLDGGKLLHLIIQYCKPYKKSYEIMIRISYLTILFLGVLYFKEIRINQIIVILFLIWKVELERKKKNYIYEKFLLERYIHPKKYKQSTIIKSKDLFYKRKRHLLKIGDKYNLECDYLKEKYEKK